MPDTTTPVPPAAAARLAAIPDDRTPAEKSDMPLPANWQTVFLGGIFLILAVSCLYIAREVVLPIVLALVLKLLLQPVVRMLERIRLPRALGALIAILLLLAVFVGLGMILSGPAAHWAANLPDLLPTLEQRFHFLTEPAQHLQSTLDQMGVHVSMSGLIGGLSSRPAGMVTAVLGGTGTVASRLLETLVILFYLLVFGETFLRRLVEILPHFDEKREAVELSLHIERDLSAYLVTVTLINAVVGVATGGVMWLDGIPAPAIWGVIAFCLNFIPYAGPFLGIVLFVVVGLLVKGGTWFALLPGAAYLAVHVAEGEIITPMLLARRFTINPVALMLALVFWFWMWGVPGAILAVPMLAIAKIICDRLRPLRAFGHLLEG
jgi:predicted PurR-regulated permease PerM